jgi:hypothetical protein
MTTQLIENKERKFLKTDLKIFLDIFPKFDINYFNFYKKKKRNGVLKIKIN